MPAAEHHGVAGARAALLLLRHATSTWNEAGRYQGWADPALTAAGVREARAWADGAPRCLSAVACSDLRRAETTAHTIADALRIGEVVRHPGLREQNAGKWTGLTKAQVKQRWPERLRERPRRPVGGESDEEVRARVVTALAELAEAHAGGCVLVITHSAVIRTLERGVGLDAPSVPHLRGRWFGISTSADGPCLTHGEPSPAMVEAIR